MVYFQNTGMFSWGWRIPLNSSHMMMKNGIRVAATIESALWSSVSTESTVNYPSCTHAHLSAAIHWPQDVANRKNKKNIKKLYPAAKPRGSPTMK